MLNKILVGAMVAAGFLSAPLALAQEGSLMVRARAVYVDFKNGQRDGLDARGLGKMKPTAVGFQSWT